MTDPLVALFREVPKDAIDQVVYLTRGRVAPDYAGVELGLAEKLAIRAIAMATGQAGEAGAATWKNSGALGTVSEELLRTKTQGSLVREPLTVEKVHANLREIATESGAGSQDRKSVV